ncbi:class I SAM-dependent methyltransferase [Nocardiopsis kunsanensis]|uniref:Methyltransferase n=1 Tax=Nocardiopsis kunsanensis TaxID=141693 RepID=A0A918XGT3_9ACTN|nr:SAM-dependent methyltransferase [Nocardiopsis kunsanensis]GHD30684.1 methyltransferase [Nocardiopsis kunsanensis]
MHAAAFEALLTEAGRELLGGIDPTEAANDRLAVASRLRAEPGVAALRPDLPASDLVNALLTQITLRERARAKFGDRAASMFFTPDGAEQATRASVAAYRAGRLAEAGVQLSDARPAGDLCCGIGADLIALAEHGVPVEGTDTDPLTVAVARANIAALGLEDTARARQGDATVTAPGHYPVLFCDPARRGGRGRVFDPDAYSPPWGSAVELARESQAACLKAAPGIPHEVLPEDSAAEWISVDGELKEAALWFGALAQNRQRRATVLHERPGLREREGEAAHLEADPDAGPAPVAPARRYLYDPDPAVVRSHLVAEAAARVDGALLDERIAYFTSDRAEFSPLWRVLEVEAVMPFSLKKLRAALRERGVGTVTVKKRGSAVDTERLRRDLRPSGPEAATVVLTRVGERPWALVCREVA